MEAVQGSKLNTVGRSYVLEPMRSVIYMICLLPPTMEVGEARLVSHNNTDLHYIVIVNGNGRAPLIHAPCVGVICQNFLIHNLIFMAVNFCHHPSQPSRLADLMQPRRWVSTDRGHCFNPLLN